MHLAQYRGTRLIHELSAGVCIRRLLSEAAAQLADADVTAMEAAAAGYLIHLTDVQPGLDVHSFFSRWGDNVAAVQQASGSDTGALSSCHKSFDCIALLGAHTFSITLCLCVQRWSDLTQTQLARTPSRSWAAASATNFEFCARAYLLQPLKRPTLMCLVNRPPQPAL